MGRTVVLVGIVLGAMMAIDMGGPINKAAYTFRNRHARRTELRVHCNGHGSRDGAATGVWHLPRHLFKKRFYETGARSGENGLCPWGMLS